MKLIVVIGPFAAPNSWLIERNIRRAEALALAVWKAGAACVCPHTNTRFFFGAHDESVFLEGYREILRRSDAGILVPGWENSSGSLAEVEEARRAEIPVFHTMEGPNGLVAWLRAPAAPLGNLAEQ
jgi:hypothetical protein